MSTLAELQRLEDWRSHELALIEEFRDELTEAEYEASIDAVYNTKTL